MHKQELINRASLRAGLNPKTIRKVLETMLNEIDTALQEGEKVTLKGFGTFMLKERAARQVRNMHSGAMIEVPARSVPYFKPGKLMKEQVGEAVKPGIIDERTGEEFDETGNGENWAAEPGSEDLTAATAAEENQNTSRARVIAVTSGKGGTGKTNFVINTAISLALRGLKVYVIDADLGTANVDVLLGLQCKHTINTLLDNPGLSLLDITAEGPEGVKIIPGGSGLQTLAELPSDELGRLVGMLKPLEKMADVILIDTGSGISRNVVDFALAADQVVVVITPEPHSISDAYAIIKVLGSKENCPDIKLVFNLVENGVEAKQVASRLLDVTERFLSVSPSPLGHIVKDDNLVRSVKQFKPIVLYNPLAPAARNFITIADRLVPTGEPLVLADHRGPGFFGKLKSIFSRSVG